MAEEEKVLSLTLDLDNTALASLVGPMDANVRQIEVITETTISRRNQTFRIAGPLTAAREAMHALQALAQKASQAGDDLTSDDVQLFFVGENAKKQDGDSVANAVLHTKRRELQGRTPRQNDYIKAILDHDIAFGIGPAGTGKTYLAVAAAVDAYERDRIERIILTRPAVEAGERLGFLPGDLQQKVDPYLRPLYDALFDMLGAETYQKYVERGSIEVAPLAYMRGRTLDNAFIILDEAQNTTPAQMKMFLTRIGFGSKVVITGDSTQKDLPSGAVSGLDVAEKVVKGIEGISICTLTSKDVVRHPLVQKIVKAYEEYEKNSARQKNSRRRKV